MSKQPHEERTFVILKPDAIRRALTGDILNRFEKTGLKFVGMKFMVPQEDKLLKHYNKDDEWFQKKGERAVEDLKAQGKEVTKEAIEYGRDMIKAIVNYMTAGPTLMLVVEGNQAVGVIMKIVGSTEPLSAEIGTIRGDLTVDSYGHAAYEDRAVRNLIHCSDSVEEAEREISLWFKEDELTSYRTAQEWIMYGPDED